MDARLLLAPMSPRRSRPASRYRHPRDPHHAQRDAFAVGRGVLWNEFYGSTTEKFFYHPVDPQTTYHTSTVLRQMGSSQDDKVGSGVPASQSLSIHQRPPQFDYIYRANRDAKRRARAADHRQG
jgi:hypothetical protein